VYHKHGDHIVTGFSLIFTHRGHFPPPEELQRDVRGDEERV
jgi:hypothetical protein